MRKCILVTGLAAGIYVVFRFLLPLVFPFVIAGIVSIVYYPLLRRLYKDSDIWEGRKKKWILVLSVVLFYVVVILLISGICNYLVGQCQSIWLNFPFYQAKIIAIAKDCCCQIDVFLRIEDGTSFAYIEQLAGNIWGDSLSGMLPKVTTYSVQVASTLFGVFFEIVVTVMATFFMIQDYEGIREKMLQSEWGRNVCRVIAKCKDTLKTYVKAQGLIMLLDGTLCTVAFLLIGQPYYLVLGPLVGVVDALPVMGAGLVLIPYILFLLLTKEAGKALVLVLAYVGCVLIRQITEPKMIGNKMGIRPLYSLISMYVGFQLFGVLGFLLGPVGVLIGKELFVVLANKRE